jgi:cyanophycinase
MMIAKSGGPKNGSLLIIGSTIPSEIEEAAIRLAGGDDARWIVIPTAQENTEGYVPPNFTKQSRYPPIILHTRDKAKADSEKFVASLRWATAVWLHGGRQYRFVDAYAGTLTEKELRAVLDRNGLIAGASAGATIQGSYLVRGTPNNDNHIMMCPGHETAFGYISNSAIDQHVNDYAGRPRDLDVSEIIKKYPHLLGIGIDNETAVVVQKNKMSVIGQRRVLITDGADHEGKPFYALRKGDHYDLATWAKLP